MTSKLFQRIGTADPVLPWQSHDAYGMREGEGPPLDLEKLMGVRSSRKKKADVRSLEHVVFVARRRENLGDGRVIDVFAAAAMPADIHLNHMTIIAVGSHGWQISTVSTSLLGTWNHMVKTGLWSTCSSRSGQAASLTYDK